MVVDLLLPWTFYYLLLLRELFFLENLKNAGEQVFYSNYGDYQVKDIIFEIGGKNKTRKQIKNIDNSFLVKDDIYASSKNTIPLILFGFLY